MEYSMYVYSTCQLPLSKILELQDQPISEEQAWALCYQLCTILSLDRHDGRGQHYTCSKMWQLPSASGILLMNDGSICLSMDDSSTNYFAFETEDKMVDHLGRLIYSCLDWGLDSTVERELNETLEVLVCQMTKVDLNHSVEESFEPVCTLSEVIQICENRLYDPLQSEHHYRAVCSTLFSETVELYRYFYNVQHNKQVLQKLVIEPETRNFSQDATQWAFAWKHLLGEMRRGVSLKPWGERLNVSAPLPTMHTPFKQLLDDITLRRYTLRKVQTVGKRYKSVGHHEALMKLICSRPKLKPASERKLNALPNKGPSLHELLMGEIRTADKLKLLSSRKRRLAYKDNGSSPLNSLIPLCEDSSIDDTSFLLNSIPTPDLQEAETEEETYEERIFQQTINRPVDPELKFLPAHSSSPLDPFGCSRRKSRSRSLGSHLEAAKPERTCEKAPLPLTIADVIKKCQTELKALKAISCNGNRNWRVCSNCSKKSFYFTWHNHCFLCNRVVCPQCCMEMRIPYKWCVNLPVSFFKKIVLNKGCEQEVRNFWRERWAWDCTRIPLVLESLDTNSLPLPTLAMRDWYSQDICTGCKCFLLDACDSVCSLFPAPFSQDV